MQTFLQDLRYGVRVLVKRPGYAAVAVVALALGIGVNTTIFSVVNALLMKPLPFNDLDRIVAVWERMPSQGVDRNETAPANFADWRAESRSFEQMGVYTGWAANLTGVDTPERVQGYRVTAGLFDALGVRPLYGRNFTAAEEERGKDAVAILGHSFWRRRFGGDPSIVGRTIQLNGVAREVVGVMPPELNFPRGGEVFAPLALTPQQAANRGAHYLLTVARLKPGVTLAQAQAEMDGIAARLAEKYPNTNTGRGVVVNTLLGDTVLHYRPALLVLMAAVGFVLLIACANVANLLLARAAGRQKELAVRAALGASRLRVVRQLLTESLILSVVGGGCGVLIAFWASDLIRSSIPAEFVSFIPGWARIGVDARALGFTLGLSVLTGLLFGLAPALQASRPDLNATLKEGGKASGAVGGQRLRGALIVAEVALSFVLLIGTGLMVKSFLGLVTADPGFDSEGVLAMELALPAAKYNDAARRADFYRQLVARLEAVPGVEAAGVVNHLPLGGSNSSTSFLLEGQPEPPPGRENEARYRVCSPRYFETLGMRLAAGRAFTEQDAANAPPVVIVNRTLARRYWPGEDPLGKRIRETGDPARNPWMQVVGVVGDVKHEMNQEVTPEFYVPHAQRPAGEMNLVVRTKGEPVALAATVRNEVLVLDKDQPVYRTRPMTQVRAESLMLQRFAAVALGVFALIALALAGVGLYGVMSYTVSQRTHEIGVRMALGARGADVLRLVVGQGMKLALIGLGIGLAGSLALTRAIAGLLYGVSATDPATFTLIALVLAGVALLACYVPARRATKVDPMVALRCE
jgi:putative ABC transport system permease protein